MVVEHMVVSAAELDAAILGDLESDCRAIVTTTRGALLVTAGPGAGKTLILARRAAYAATHGEIDPAKMLALTFTNRAAREMRQRVDRCAPNVSSAMTISTLHSLCARILREEAHILDRDGAFAILDDLECHAVIARVRDPAQIDPAIKAEDLLATIARYKDDGVYPHIASTRLKIDPSHRDLYARYQAALEEQNALDFADLIAYGRLLLTNDRLGARERLRERFVWVEVDEFQDTGVAEYEIIAAIAAGSGDLCCFADPGQAIYSWRGVDFPAAVARFRSEFSPHEVTLTRGRRMPPRIDAAVTAIASAESLSPRPDAASDADDVRLIAASDRDDEARAIARLIDDRVARGEARYRDYAIVARTNRYLRELESRLDDLGLPIRRVDGARWWDDPLARDIVACLRAIQRPDSAAARRVLSAMAPDLSRHDIAAMSSAHLLLTDWFGDDVPAGRDPCGAAISAWNDGDIVALDFETTGLDVTRAEIIEIGAIRLHAGREVETFATLVRTDASVAGSARVHGIDDATLAERGVEPSAAIAGLTDFLGSTPIIGHNLLGYDLPLLRRTQTDHGLTPFAGVAFDTLDLARRATPLPRLTLDRIARHLGLASRTDHRAEADARVAGWVAARLIEQIGQTATARMDIIRKYRDALQPVVDVVNGWRSLAETVTLARLIESIAADKAIAKSSATGTIVARLMELATSKVADTPASAAIDDFVNVARLGSGLDEFDRTANVVPLLTIHSAKGMEFDHVVLAGATDDLIPLGRTRNDAMLDEERRVMVVALSRARRTVTVTYPRADGGRRRLPSRFLAPIAHLDTSETLTVSQSHSSTQRLAR
ncbi:MAG: hypothetical protein EPO26_18010 [Chloroflexota bacterium]|nr:MAG: hypothetical protein EPO26_18010 [Chloroflexota bacterium]